MTCEIAGQGERPMPNFHKPEPTAWETVPMAAKAPRLGMRSRSAGFSREILRVGVRSKAGLKAGFKAGLALLSSP